MQGSENNGTRRISANLPQELIEGVDELKKEWGLRSRGAVLERLLESLFTENGNVISSDLHSLSDEDNINDVTNYNEDKAIVLIGKSDIALVETKELEQSNTSKIEIKEAVNNPTIIDLPGFVSSKTKNLKRSLNSKKVQTSEFVSYINTVKDSDINLSLKKAKEHWIYLYGSHPGENVVEAAMIWLARDIWPHIDSSENKAFTWSASNKSMREYYSNWTLESPSFERIIVTAGILEDPFSSNNLVTRIPTIIRRFVNRFKRRQNGTSFQTIESTMTVHGALKLLGLPTQAGSSLTLISIREAYKTKAMESHPDSGGSTETMRKLNEAYQLLKDLYKKK
ncbi:DnaJ domain-containing protein [Prochlorococcus sp. MIT 1223]|uniref:DnaJ domain-containing protein n=1 Tax=Prochlorococcus sp. MIT 1223 TaxID=3096217 RepID=UPI002A75CA01|nr:DnaJ domain-containing protein [Prochlorococcus sp. MIT 1223]